MEDSSSRSVKEVKVVNVEKKKNGSLDIFLRVLGFVLPLVSAIVVGADKQTKLVPFSIGDDLPSLQLPVTAKWHYLSAVVYFLAANIIACSYGFLSLFLSLTNKSKNSSLGIFVIILDIVMVALLFSGGGAAAAVGIIGYEGNSHVMWKKVCNVFGRFCSQLTAALALSFAGALAFMLLVVMAALGLHNRPK